MSALSILHFLNATEPVRDDQKRRFSLGGRDLEIDSAIVVPDVLFYTLETVDDVESGEFMLTLPNGRSQRAGTIFKAIRQHGYLGAHAEVRLEELREDRRLTARMLRTLWRLRCRDAESIVRFQKEAREFSQYVAEQVRRYPEVEEIEEHVLKIPALSNGVGFSPYTSVPPTWAAMTDIDASIARLQELRYVTLNVGEILGMFVERIDAYLEGVSRVAEQAIASDSFKARRTKAQPGQFITMAEELEQVRLRPYARLCGKCAVDFRAAAELYEQGDVHGSIDRLQRIVDAIALSHVFVEMEDILRDVSMDLRRGETLTDDSRRLLRLRTGRLAQGFPWVQTLGDHGIVERAGTAILGANTAALSDGNDVLERIREAFLEPTPGH